MNRPRRYPLSERSIAYIRERLHLNDGFADETPLQRFVRMLAVCGVTALLVLLVLAIPLSLVEFWTGIELQRGWSGLMSIAWMCALIAILPEARKQGTRQFAATLAIGILIGVGLALSSSAAVPATVSDAPFVALIAVCYGMTARTIHRTNHDRRVVPQVLAAGALALAVCCIGLAGWYLGAALLRLTPAPERVVSLAALMLPLFLYHLWSAPRRTGTS